MSRCFPFSPQGYEKKITTDEADSLIKVTILEKDESARKSWKKLEKDESGSPETPIQIKINLAYTEHLSSYERACCEDPKLESFDSALHERTNRVINKLASGVEFESLSFDSLREVMQCLFDMNQDVVKVILQEKEEIWNNQDLFSLVNMYFESTVKTKAFCSELENCLNCARRNQLIIQFAVKHFEEEAEIPANGNNENEKYEKTLEELKRFKSAGDPFTREFFSHFDLVHKHQITMLEELHKLKKKLVKRLKNIKSWRIVSNMVFVTAFISMLILSVVSAAVAAPPVVAAVARLLDVPMGSAGKWCNSLWMKFQNVVRGQNHTITLTTIQAYTVKEMDNISVLVSKVEVEIESLLNNAEFAVTAEKVVKLAIDEIKKKLDVFTETIEELGEHADKFCRNVTMVRTVILHRSIRYPTGLPREEGTCGLIEFIWHTKSNVNPKDAEIFQAEASSSRDDSLNPRKNDNFTDSEANSVVTSNLQNCVENKRVEPVTEEKKQENVRENSTMVNYDKPPQEHNVFINFRGEDLRHGFVGDLVKALKRDGVKVYIDVHELPRVYLTELLLKGMEESRIALVIFTSGYTESRWCLNELVKIRELMERGKLLVIPIFYKVEPLEVTQLKGDFGVKFWNLWRISRDHRIIKWKEALESIASMTGIYSKEHCSDSEFITIIVKKVLERISTWEGESTELPTGKGEKHETYLNKNRLFGMEQRLENVEKKLEFDCNETRIIGVVGMAGIGKTTLAMMLHEKWNCKFIRCLPLLDIRKKSEEYGIVWLRKTLLEVLLEGKFSVISDKTTHESVKNKLLQTKVFVVLDDVSDKKQINFLLGNLDWIKKGSKVVITTCDKSLLEGFVSDTYVVPVLNDREAFQLFNYHAFDDHICRPTDTFPTLSKMFVDYARGHPLALNLLGRELRGKDKAHWEHKLATVTTSSSMMFRDVWRFSTDLLNERQKEVFLDIVCFFKSEDEYFVRSLLDSGDPDSIDTVSEVRDLANKFLITISDGRIEMNDLVYTFGKNLSSPRWLRLWNCKDIINELTKMEKSKANNVRGIFLDSSKLKKNIYLDSSTFIDMLNLRYIKIYDSCCPRRCSADYKLYFLDGLDFPVKEVRYLHWLKFPLEELPPDFRPDNLVDLRLPYSRIKRVWEGVKDTPRLKWVDLSYSTKLLDLSALSTAENLQSLNLEGCTVLDELPLEIQNMKSLVFLNLRECTRLRYLPKMNLISLKTLILSGCTNLEEFQLISESLVVLHLDGTAIKGLPPTIKKLQRLVLLNLKNCKMLKSLPNCIRELKALEELILSGCSRLKNLSNVRESMKHIQSLLVDRVGAKEMPIISFIGVLEGKASADMALQPFGPKEWPRGLNGVCYLRRLCLNGNDFVSLQTDIGKLYNLNWLEVKQCKLLISIPMLPPNLQYFDAHGCDSLERVANPLALPGLSEKIHATYIFSNCNKLDQDAKDNIISYTRWRSQVVLEALSRYNGGSVLQDFTGTCFPGLEVPAWFSHQASGSVLKLKLPPHLCDNRFTGIALCAVISFPGYHEQKNTLVVKCNCVFINEDGSCSRFSYTFGSWSKSSYTPGKLDPSHVFIGYTSLLDIQTHDEEDDEGCSHTEASFEFQVTDGTEVLGGCEVLKCGFSLVYETNERESINWDAKTGLIPEKIKNIPGEATSYGNSGSHDDIQYESYSGLTLGMDETLCTEAKSDVTPNLQKSFENKKVDLLKEESDVGKDIIVRSSRNLENIKRHPLVGLELRLKQIEKVLYSTPGKTRIVGVLGMPGIGKTTLAKKIFAKHGCKFPSPVFLTMSKKCRLEQLRRVFLKELLKNVNQDINEETTHESMKDKLLQTKVFVVLDGASDKKQLEFLLGDLDWIKKGSKIVITTCDKSLLKGLAHDTYVVPQLNNKEAFQIFTYHAFYNHICPTNAFLSLSRMLVDNVGANPLDLEVLGSVLCGLDEACWQFKLLKARQSFNMKMTDVWRFSIDQLNEQQKDVFLDMVYFFKIRRRVFC